MEPHILRQLKKNFWENVLKTDNCWRWIGYSPNGRYGMVRYYDGGRKGIAAHRASWIIHFGDIPEDKNVLHNCDVTKCVRPDHLYLGNQKRNMLDMYDRFRRYPNAFDPDEIREKYEGGVTGRALAKEYEISVAQVSRIVNRVGRWSRM